MKNSAPSKSALIWLIIALSLAAAPHFFYQPIWVSLIFLLGLSWRCLNIWFAVPLPKGNFDLMRLIQLTIAASAIALLFVTYGSTVGRDAGVAFLLSMLGLKVTEIRTHRDYYLTAFLGYFVVITNFFFTQSMLVAGLMFVVVIVTTSCLICINNQTNQLPAKAMMKLSAKMLVQALPMMLILFVLFPRIPGPLWGLPEDAHGNVSGDSSNRGILGNSGQTGIDNKMQLGKISRLIQSDKVAFRVQFDGEIPAAGDRYWRGPVLWHTNGSTWTETDYSLINKQPIMRLTEQAIDYQIVLEPHNQHWLFALDLPSAQPEGIDSYFTSDAQLKSAVPITQRIRYSLNSSTDFTLGNNDPALLKLALSLPDAEHPQAIALAQQWRTEFTDDESYIQHVLNYFNREAFYYSLTPPQLTGDVIDQFLFESKEGFCEHYSASFAVLMRAAGIPTRIVTGYQGGEINPVSGDLVIRQRDAHAWTEVWLKNKGWVRIDPTAAVSAERVNVGMNEIMPLEMRSPALFANYDALNKLWQKITYNLDALDSMWNLWVLSYSPALQRALLEKLGMTNPNWQKIALCLGIFISAVLIILPLFVFYQRRPNDPLNDAYRQFCKKLTKVGLYKRDNEGPLDFSRRAVHILPKQRHDIEHITGLYIDQKYGSKTKSLAALKQAIKQFEPTAS